MCVWSRLGSGPESRPSYSGVHLTCTMLVAFASAYGNIATVTNVSAWRRHRGPLPLCLGAESQIQIQIRVVAHSQRREFSGLRWGGVG
ncbi:hypothetical protein R3P38DRAFT_1052687 [Favolaschia claudopus]|uniref:Uncharacterized protein n=1 Tax=Favolaschia claudopus TaxID=2862362 RepID=A0AAW0BFI9_9AGAR